MHAENTSQSSEGVVGGLSPSLSSHAYAPPPLFSSSIRGMPRFSTISPRLCCVNEKLLPTIIGRLRPVAYTHTCYASEFLEPCPTRRDGTFGLER